jgi:hypothetical protein
MMDEIPSKSLIPNSLNPRNLVKYHTAFFSLNSVVKSFGVCIPRYVHIKDIHIKIILGQFLYYSFSTHKQCILNQLYTTA